MTGEAELNETVRIEQDIARLHARFVDATARFVDVRGCTDESAAEVGVALGWAGSFARRRLELATQLVTRLPRTLDALRRGEVDLVKASKVAGPTTPLPDTLATRVDHLVADRLAGATAGSIQRTVKKAVLDVDPEGQSERAEHERAQRHVRLTHGDGTMATLAGELPAETAQAAYARVDTTARALRRSGDRRSLDQLRADVYGGFLLGHDPLGHDKEATSPLPAQTPSPAPVTPPAPPRPSTKADVFVHIDLATLAGLANDPAELAGHGPLPASVARAIAHDPTSTWRRIITDPHTGAPLDVGRTRYRPPKALADYVKVRDRTCRFPGCHRPSDHVDLDHVVPHGCDGPTCAANLIGLCRPHHRVKHTAGWTFRLNPDGTLHITTPTGRRIATPPAHETDLGTHGDDTAGNDTAGTPPPDAQEPRRRPEPHTGRRSRRKIRKRGGRSPRRDTTSQDETGPQDETGRQPEPREHDPTSGDTSVTATGGTSPPADSAD
ncbi:HNH endonuclease signature motif containing protein [Prauserella halophila]|nr:HNH endonuclease signature motif containing protein [Prauserella halophila]MCP2238420.1 protein of unknown function (DUF222) [Prauserella halophila]